MDKAQRMAALRRRLSWLPHRSPEREFEELVERATWNLKARIDEAYEAGRRRA